MEKELSWDYWTDHDSNANTGKFYLYRNSMYLGSNNMVYYRYSTYPKTEENAAFHITNTSPVAAGITAFFVAGLRTGYRLYDELRFNRHFDSEELYKIYLRNVSKWTFLENNKAPVKRPYEEVNYIFLCEHIKSEKKCLIASEPYYSEFLDEQDKSTKEKIHEYVLGYISWIEKKIKSLSPEAQITISDKIKPGIINSQHETINKTSIISSYLIKIRSFLDFFIKFYNLQLNPSTDYILAEKIGLGMDYNSKFDYYIKSNSPLANIKDFREIITDALLDPGIDKGGLISLISGLYKLTEKILSLPSQEYVLYSLSRVVSIMLEYRSNNVTYHPLGSVIPDHSLIFYDNFKFFDFVKEMNGFLELTISQASPELNNSNIPAGKISSEDSVSPPDENKKNDEHPLAIPPKSPDASDDIENETNDDDKLSTESVRKNLSEILDPLSHETFTKGNSPKNISCIDLTTLSYLKQQLEIIISKKEEPVHPASQRKVYYYEPLYDAICIIQDYYQIAPLLIIKLLAAIKLRDINKTGSGLDHSIRSALSLARKRLESKQ